MTAPRDFTKDLRNGLNWEKKLATIIEKFIITYKVKNIKYSTEEGRKIQRSGVDYTLSAAEQGWEAKTRSNIYYLRGILLETVSVEHQNIPGWVYTSEADVIAYVWQTQNKLNLEPVGYLILLKRLREHPQFKTMLNMGYTITAHSQWGNQEWTTISKIVEINNFPAGTLYSFNPTLENTQYKQMKLDRPDKLSSYFK